MNIKLSSFKEYINKNDQVLVVLFISVLLTAIYFLLAIGSPHLSAKFITEKDGGALYTPMLMNLSSLLRDGFSVQGIDWLTHNGASEFFVRANISALYPPLLISAYIFKITSFNSATIFHLCFLCIHLILALIFLQRIGIKYFKFSITQAIFFAIAVVFSSSVVYGLFFKPFFLAFCLFPLSLYCNLYAAESKSYIKVFLTSFITFNYLLAGYLPLALAGVLLSFILAFAYINWINPENYVDKVKATIMVVIGNVIGSIFAFPAILSIVHYINYSEPTGMRNLAYAAFSVAHNINELAANLISEIPNSSVELFGIVGLGSILIIIAYFAALREDKKSHTIFEKKLLQISATIFLAIFLIQFGRDIPLSIMFYKFVPGLGDMHSYQRYAIYGCFFLGIFTTVALNYLFSEHCIRVRKIFAAACFFSAIFLSFGMQFYSNYMLSNINWSHLIVVLFLMSLLFISRSVFTHAGAWLVAACMVLLIGVSLPYSLQQNVDVEHKIVSKINEQENSYLIDFFRNNSNSKIIKYINLIPVSKIYSYVPRNYPWLVQNKIKLSEYYGYELHIAADNNYRKYAPFYGVIDWDWLRKTGAEFIIYNQENMAKDVEFINKYVSKDVVMQLSNGDIVAKFKDNFMQLPTGYNHKVFNNGYILAAHTTASPEISNFKAKANKISFDINVKDNKTLVKFLFWPNRHLHLKIDGVQQPWVLQDDMYTYTFKHGIYDVKFEYYYFPLWIFSKLTLVYILLLMVAIGMIVSEYYRRKALSLVLLVNKFLSNIKLFYKKV